MTNHLVLRWILEHPTRGGGNGHLGAAQELPKERAGGVKIFIVILFELERPHPGSDILTKIDYKYQLLGVENELHTDRHRDGVRGFCCRCSTCFSCVLWLARSHDGVPRLVMARLVSGGVYPAESSVGAALDSG